MSVSTISYSDGRLRQVVENWGDEKGLDAEKTLDMHMRERFEVRTIHILEVLDEGEQLILMITTELWEKPREFALLASGSLVW